MGMYDRTKTFENLSLAYQLESAATNKYLFFASQAKKDGYEQIAQVFTEVAGNEKEHAKIWFKMLGNLSNTKDNLLSAITAEHKEWSRMYKQMGDEALDEGFNEVARAFYGVADIEKSHEERFKALLENVSLGCVFHKENLTAWYCRNCGHIEIGYNAPDECPVCKHPMAFFEEKK